MLPLWEMRWFRSLVLGVWIGWWEWGFWVGDCEGGFGERSGLERGVVSWGCGMRWWGLWRGKGVLFGLGEGALVSEL